MLLSAREIMNLKNAIRLLVPPLLYEAAHRLRLIAGFAPLPRATAATAPLAEPPIEVPPIPPASINGGREITEADYLSLCLADDYNGDQLTKFRVARALPYAESGDAISNLAEPGRGRRPTFNTQRASFRATRLLSHGVGRTRGTVVANQAENMRRDTRQPCR